MIVHDRERTRQFTELGDGRVVETWWGGATWCQITKRGEQLLSATMGHADRRAAVAFGTGHGR